MMRALVVAIALLGVSATDGAAQRLTNTEGDTFTVVTWQRNAGVIAVVTEVRVSIFSQINNGATDSFSAWLLSCTEPVYQFRGAGVTIADMQVAAALNKDTAWRPLPAGTVAEGLRRILCDAGKSGNRPRNPDSAT